MISDTQMFAFQELDKPKSNKHQERKILKGTGIQIVYQVIQVVLLQHDIPKMDSACLSLLKGST